MDRKHDEVFTYMLELSEEQGYITFDDIIDSADKWDLPIQDVDWLSSSLTTRGVLVYDTVPVSNATTDRDEYDDFAQNDYDAVYQKVVQLDPSLEPFIDVVRNIIPPQLRELSQLKYQVKEGNSHARNRMIEMHLRMAVRIALQRAETYDMEVAESLGYACIGLITAVDRYDPDTTGAFASYASLWMLQIISREQSTRRPLMYFPVHRKEPYFSMYPVLKYRGCLECDEIVDCVKVRDMICVKLECNSEQAEEIISACTPFESLDMLLEASHVTEMKEDVEEYSLRRLFCADVNIEKVVEFKTLQHEINILLGSMKERERDVIIARYGLNGCRKKTLEEIGQAYNLTRERIRQIEVKALKKLRNPTQSKKLIDYYLN